MYFSPLTTPKKSLASFIRRNQRLLMTAILCSNIGYTTTKKTFSYLAELCWSRWVNLPSLHLQRLPAASPSSPTPKLSPKLQVNHFREKHFRKRRDSGCVCTRGYGSVSCGWRLKLILPLPRAVCLWTLQWTAGRKWSEVGVDLQLPPGGGWARSGEGARLRSVLWGHLAVRWRNSKWHSARRTSPFPHSACVYSFFR